MWDLRLSLIHISAEQLRFSATTGLNGAVLAKGARLTGNAEWKDVALEAGRFIKNTIIPSLDFSDFEAYYSCSPKPLYFMDNETGIKPHCNLSIQWCCDLMLELYRLTGDKNWLDDGEYLLNIMCLYQQIWDPPFYPEYLYGGLDVYKRQPLASSSYPRALRRGFPSIISFMIIAILMHSSQSFSFSSADF